MKNCNVNSIKKLVSPYFVYIYMVIFAITVFAITVINNIADNKNYIKLKNV